MESYSPSSLQQRMAAGLSLRGGSRGSLTRCLGRLAAGADARSALRRELQLTHVELTKLALQVQRQDAEYQQLLLLLCDDNNNNNNNNNNSNADDNNNNDTVTKARAAVQALRAQHQDAIATKACKAEYEALAKICATRYPIPRRILQQRMQTAAASIEQKTLESQTLSAHVRVREKQFAALMQGLADLKQSLVAEPLELFMTAHEMSCVAVDNNNNNNNATNNNNNDNAMQMDSPDKQQAGNNQNNNNNNNKQDQDDDDDDDGEEEEEGALYEDL